jgi:DNA primase
MSNICFDSFVDWANNRFNGNVVVKGSEVRLNSIFEYDTKYHLWCSPSGGKHNRPDGCYQCFKTGKRGTLVGLVMLVEGLEYGQAKDLISSINPLDLEDQVKKLLGTNSSFEKDPPLPDFLPLPKGTFYIKDAPDYYKNEAIKYLSNRSLSVGDLAVCVEGEYRDRIVIPYKDKKGRIIYYNCRLLHDNGLRYLGPPKSVGVGKSDVLYMVNWRTCGGKIYLTEGEFDAISLQYSGLDAAAVGGKTVSDTQLFKLLDFQVCLAFDQDAYGLPAVREAAVKLIGLGVNTSFVRPAKGYKDWNLMLQRFGPNVVREYILSKEKSADLLTIDMLLS